MRLITKSRLRVFWARFPDSREALEAWCGEALPAKWRTPADIKKKYGNASIVSGNRVVFNICGNKYRLVLHIHYNTGFMYVRFVGTHAEYDKIDVKTV
ncbi:MAG: type II toxin-antitoxin system HigB family toxin [bacterium]